MDKRMKEYLSNNISNYIYTLKKSIGNEIKDKIKIYLDLNIFIDILKLKNGIPFNRPFVEELYNQIKHLVNERKAVVLISDIHIFEAFKPKKKENLNKLISLMNSMSGGYCISDSETIEFNEILFCLRLLFQIDNAEYYLFREAYTKPIFCLQTKIPDMINISKLSNSNIDELQKDFIDFVWPLSLNEIYLKSNNPNFINFKEVEEKITEYLSIQRPLHSNEYSDFDDLFKKEIFGSLDLYKDRIKADIENYFSTYDFITNELSDKLFRMDIDEKYIRIIDSIISALIQTKKFDALSAVSIGSGLHTLKRFNESYKYGNGDTFDYYHAKRALPYADYFFTEKTLCGMIKDSHLKFDKVFNCKVFSKLDKGICELKKHNSI